MKKSIFFKALFLIVSVILLYITLILLIFAVENYTNFTDKNKTLVQNALIQNQIEIDYKLTTTQNYINTLKKNKNIVYFTNNNTLDYQNVTDIYSELASPTGFSNGLGFNIAISKPNHDFVISSKGTFSEKNFLKNFDMRDVSEKNLTKAFKNDDNLPNRYFVPMKEMKKGSSYFIYIEKIFINTDVPLIVYIILDKSNLFIENIPNNKGYFNVETKDNIFAEKYTANYKKLYNSFKPSEKKLNSNLILVKKNKENDFEYTAASRKFPNLTYNYYINHRNIGLFPTSFVIKFSIFLLILIISGVLITIFLMKKTIYPFLSVARLVSNDDEYNPNNVQLENIVNKINHINSENSRLQNQFSNSIEALRENFFRKIFYNDLVNTSEENLKKLNLDHFSRGGTLILLNLNGFSKYEESLTKQNVSSLRKLLINKIQPDNITFKFFLVPLSFKEFCLVTAEQNHLMINRALLKLCNNIEKDLKLDVTFYQSDAVEQIEDFTPAFQSAISLKDDYIWLTDSRVIKQSSFSSIKKDVFPFNLQKELLISLLNSNLEKFTYYFHNLFKKITQQARYESQLDIQETKFLLLYSLKLLLLEKEQSLVDLIKNDSNVYDIFLAPTNHNLEKDTLNLFLLLFPKTTEEKQNSPQVKKIITYIGENFSNDISLTDISQKFHLSEGYISKILKEEANISFKAYVNELKVARAKELLETGKYKVSEVSSLVGCSNVNTFIRMFKRIEGISPGEYIKIKYSN